MIINTLPKITWRFVKANNTELDELEIKGKEYFKESVVENKEFSKYFENLEFGLSKEILEINEKHRNFQKDIVIESKNNIFEKYKFEFLNEKDELIDLQNIHIKEGASATLLYDVKSPEDLKVLRNSLFRIRAEKDSKLKLILLQRLSKESVNLVSVVSNIGENAEVHLVQVELGSDKSFVNYCANLIEPYSKSYINTAYFVDGERELDINYWINHISQNTVSDMSVNGALKDISKKRFAGTLDFKKGSAGSNGNEEEYVTLLDKEVRNFALPLLLAHEHDIQGNHAASAGRIDKDMLYYIMSRGLSEKEAKSIVVESKITPILDLIDDENIKEEIKTYIHKRITE